MKLVFIYLGLVLAISFYLWINVFKEGISSSRSRVTYTPAQVAEQQEKQNARIEEEKIAKQVSDNILEERAIADAITDAEIERGRIAKEAEAKADALAHAETIAIASAQALALAQAHEIAIAEAAVKAKVDAEEAALAQLRKNSIGQTQEQIQMDANATDKLRLDSLAAQSALLLAQSQAEQAKKDANQAQAALLVAQTQSKNITQETKQTRFRQKVSPGISSIDRYADPMCKPNEYIYCLDGQIECQDILGGKMNNLQGMAPYISGNTLAGCSSYVNKVDIRDYTKEINTNINTGVYFDLSNCNNAKPWRVGGTVNKVGKDSTVSSYTCYPSEMEADNARNGIIVATLNSNALYKLNDNVYVLDSFLKTLTTQGLPQILAVLDSNKKSLNTYSIINGQKYYYGKITQVTGMTYTVSIASMHADPAEPIKKIDLKSVPKNALLKNSLYNSKTNDYYNNLTTKSHPRPVCKSGAFTSCLSSPPFIIENGSYVSMDDPELSVDASYNQYRKQAQIDLNSLTPFSSAPVNPSGIMNSELLEYNYFTTQNKESPFIKCIADYGSNIGDPLCCNQEGIINDTKYICPQEVPTCMGYSVSDNAYGYCG